MNLAALANIVCEKVGKTDSESIEQCKSYLRQRHEMVYDAALWKDTVDTWEVDVDANTTRVVLPYTLARPLAVWDEDAGLPLPVTSLTAIAITAPARLSEVGGLWQFVESQSCGWAWDLGTSGDTLAITNNTSASVDVTIRGKRKTTLAPLPDRETEETYTVAGSGGSHLTPTWLRIDRMSKAQTTADILFAQSGRGASGLWYFPAADEEAVFAVARLIPGTDKAITLGVLGKAKLRQMRQDGDSPMIRGVDNCLLAFAQGDMLERSRQYAKAQAKVSEGATLLRMARDLETRQAANEDRVVPDVQIEEGFEEVW